MPTPLALRHAADTLRRSAHVLGPTLDKARRALTPGVWRGDAADRVRNELEEMRSTLRSVADALLGLADDLSRQAGQLDVQAALDKQCESVGARR